MQKVFQKFNAKINQSCQKHHVILHLFDQLPLSLPTSRRIFTANESTWLTKFKKAVSLAPERSISLRDSLEEYRFFVTKEHQIEGEMLTIQEKEAAGKVVYRTPIIERKISFWSIEQRGSALFSVTALSVLAILGSLFCLTRILPCVGSESWKERVVIVLSVPILILLAILGVVKRALGVIIHPGIALSYEG